MLEGPASTEVLDQVQALREEYVAASLGCPGDLLESRGVLVSAGSACAERSRKPSAVLQAIGVPESYGTVRLSFGRDTDRSDVERASKILIDAVRGFQ